MNKKTKKNIAKLATFAVAVLTAFGCFAAGCNKKGSSPSTPNNPTPNPPTPPGPTEIIPDEDEVATSTSIVNKTPLSEATIYY
ncbi:MAG: hypothetical protein K2J54_01650, partial [Clostridia bacterium]|nr:hypothetical protein [Clostridia bacterium]